MILYRIEWWDSDVKLLLKELGLDGLEQEPRITKGLKYDQIGSRVRIQAPYLLDAGMRIKVMDRNDMEIRWLGIKRKGDTAVFEQPDRGAYVEIYNERNGKVLDKLAWIPAGGMPGRFFSVNDSVDEAEWQRVRSLWEQLLGTVPSNWKELALEIGPGIARCLILKLLGAEFANVFDAARELGKGQFHDHFPRYWRQLSLIHSSLRDNNDWTWVSPFLLPPMGEAYE